MALLNFLKNKKKAEEAKEATLSKKEAGFDAKESSKSKKSATSEVSFKGFGADAIRSLKSAHITEKSSSLAADNKYVFNVVGNTNKTEIKKAVEKIYKVKVLSVNILNMPSKKRRVGRTIGTKSGFKKAVVTLPKDQKIDILAQ